LFAGKIQTSRACPKLHGLYIHAKSCQTKPTITPTTSPYRTRLEKSDIQRLQD